MQYRPITKDNRTMEGEFHAAHKIKFMYLPWNAAPQNQDALNCANVTKLKFDNNCSLIPYRISSFLTSKVLVISLNLLNA